MRRCPSGAISALFRFPGGLFSVCNDSFARIRHVLFGDPLIVFREPAFPFVDEGHGIYVEGEPVLQ